jgi:hypothetical protein
VLKIDITKLDLIEKFSDEAESERIRIWNQMRNCVHEYEQITGKHDFIHPPKCLKDCGAFMSPEDRIKNGLGVNYERP